jgi:hypothetical protein
LIATVPTFGETPIRMVTEIAFGCTYVPYPPGPNGRPSASGPDKCGHFRTNPPQAIARRVSMVRCAGPVGLSCRSFHARRYKARRWGTLRCQRHMRVLLSMPSQRRRTQIARATLRRRCAPLGRSTPCPFLRPSGPNRAAHLNPGMGRASVRMGGARSAGARKGRSAQQGGRGRRTRQADEAGEQATHGLAAAPAPRAFSGLRRQRWPE